MENLILLTADEARLRREKVQKQLAGLCDAARVTDNANIYYLSGRVLAGWAYLPAEGELVWFVRRPVDMHGENVVYIRKPEEIPAWLESNGMPLPATLGLELDIIPYTQAERLRKAFPGATVVESTGALRQARSVKTADEIEKIRLSGLKQTAVYRRIPSLFTLGMTDFELEVAIENLSRIEGCLGQFRISGQSMEFFMGNVLAGENADSPTPYDFAMGGKGMDPSLPVGASGDEIHRGEAVMVDMNGNYTGYMTDMTRVFAVDTLPELALDAHRCSIDIHRMFVREAVPGAGAAALYEKALEMVKERGLEKYYMGHRQHAGFIGHGVGIEINEWPVIAPRSRQVLEEGNVIALEPKFVIPKVGAVGVENTYVIRREGAERLTDAPEEILSLTDRGDTY